MKFIAYIIAHAAMALSILSAEEITAIDDCSEIGSNFKISPYLLVAETLQTKGEETAIRQLRKWANTGDHEDQVIILCRMLFEAKKGIEFRRPLIGGAIFRGGTDYDDWPNEPIEIYKSIPILITHGYHLAGVAERSNSYLNYCVKNCNWRKTKYSIRTPEQLKTTIEEWIDLKKWTVPLGTRDRTFFTNQGELSAKKE